MSTELRDLLIKHYNNINAATTLEEYKAAHLEWIDLLVKKEQNKIDAAVIVEDYLTWGSSND